MSRFSGPQNRGAARKLHDRRRTEAEARQAEERARDEARRQEIEREYANVKPLTGEEFVQLLSAAFGADASRRVFADAVLHGRDPFKTTPKKGDV